MGKAILENKVEGLALPDNKTYYYNVIIKMLQYECKHRQIKHWNRRERLEQTEIYRFETRFMTWYAS